MQQQWSAVDGYLIDTLIPHDPLLSRAGEQSARRAARFDVAANQGQFLALLVRMVRARGCWKSVHSADTAPSGWLVSCRKMASC